MVRQVPLKDCGQIVFSPMMDRLLVSGLPVVAFIILSTRAEPLAPPLVLPLPLTDLFYNATKKQ